MFKFVVINKYITIAGTKKKKKFQLWFGFWPHYIAFEFLVPQIGIKVAPPATEAGNVNHWTIREIPENCSTLGGEPQSTPNLETN